MIANIEYSRSGVVVLRAGGAGYEDGGSELWGACSSLRKMENAEGNAKIHADAMRLPLLDQLFCLFASSFALFLPS